MTGIPLIIAFVVVAYRTAVGVREVVAEFAIAYVATKAGDGVGHLLDSRSIHLEQMHRQTQCCSAPYTWQFGKLRYGLLQ